MKQLDFFSSNFLENTSNEQITLTDWAKEKPKKAETRTETPKPINKPTETKTVENKPNTKDNVVQFPTPVKHVEPVITNGNASYLDCVRKFEAAKKKFPDNDSQYVIDGLLELCKVDSNFRNRVMLENKTYEGAYGYMFEMAKKGVGAYKIGNSGAFMDKDTALGICIDYFNTEEAKK